MIDLTERTKIILFHQTIPIGTFSGDPSITNEGCFVDRENNGHMTRELLHNALVLVHLRILGTWKKKPPKTVLSEYLPRIPTNQFVWIHMPEHSSDQGKKPNDFLCKIKYKNTLPEIPFDPKTLAYDVDLTKYAAYSRTSLMKQHHWGYYPDTSAVLDLVDIEAWTPDAGNIRGNFGYDAMRFENFLLGFSSSFGTGY